MKFDESAAWKKNIESFESAIFKGERFFRDLFFKR